MLSPNDGAVVSLSGGADSTTVLAEAVEKYGRFGVHAISFDYGQKHKLEILQASKIAQWYGVSWTFVQLPHIFAGAGSSLVDEDVTVETIGTYEELQARFGSQPTVVPNRNMNLIAMAVTHALVKGVGHVMMGAHAGDAANYHYPDCRPAFNGAMHAAIEIATEGAVTLDVPFNFSSKGQLIKRAAALRVPMHLTQSCYNGDRPACGKCATCHERVGAFIEAGFVDPIEYANGFDLYLSIGGPNFNINRLALWPTPIEAIVDIDAIETANRLPGI